MPNNTYYVYSIGSKCSGNLVQDVVFVIDTSGSIGSFHFQLVQQFAANITTKLFHMSPENAIGVILFDSNARVQFNLHTYDNLDMLLSAINHLPFSGRGTDTAKALQLLLSNSQNSALGLRTDSSKVAIIITDGQSNSKLATFNAAAAALHASNIFDVYAVGVGGTNLTELQEISSSPRFIFNGINLQQLQHRILPQLCIG